MSEDYKDVIIGLESHVQLSNLKTKLFCGCDADYYGKEPNTCVCPGCMGFPGTFPTINHRAVEFATRLALALGCKINPSMFFFRKNYFYPDMGKNFQLTLYNKLGGHAFADGGKVTIKLKDNKKKDIQLNRIHLEEDPARLVHLGSISTTPYSLVDYNRSGITLIEVVTNPVISTPEEAREYLNQLKSIIQYTGISDLNIEGTCRVDANVSIKGSARVEVKNISSFKEVERVLKWEIQRHRNAIKQGKTIVQETRGWDEKRRITFSMRTKEFEKDYRYFPDQDLVPIDVDQALIENVKKELPELPMQRAQRFQETFKLSERDSEILIMDKDIADFFEEGVNSDKTFTSDDYKNYCNWLLGDISAWLNESNKSIKDTKLKPKNLVELIKTINDGKITGKIAKTFVNDLMQGTPLSKIIQKTGKVRIADEAKIKEVAQEVVKENQEILNDLENNPRAFEFLIGKCMQKTKGTIDPELTREIMRNLIKK